MPLNPQTEAFFNSLAQGDDSPKTHEQTPEDAREGYRALAAALGPGPDIETLDRAVPGSEAEIPVRIYTPEGEGPWPSLV